MAGFAEAQEASPGQTAQANAGASAPLEEIIVTGQRQFLSAHTEGTTNLPLPIEQVPQSISLVSADFIQAADLKTLGQIASFTPGAFDAGNPENNGSVIKIRGFAAGRAIDGINAISSYTAYEPDYAIFDRLEIVEGPSSVTYGISSPGGLVNFVTKSATAQTPSYLSAQVGSWNNIRIEGQVAGALDADGRVRAIGLIVEDRGDSFIENLYHHKTVVYGGVNADIADTLSVYVHGGYERFTRPSFDGIPTEADGTPAPVPRSFFLGSKDIVETNSVYHTEVGLQWNPLDDLEFDFKANYEYVAFTGANDYSFGLEKNGDIGIAAERFSGINNQNYGIEGSSIYHLDKIGLDESFLSVAALYQNSKQASTTLYPADTSITNIFAGSEAIRQAFNSQINQRLFPYISQINTDTFTISGQSVIKVFDHLSTLLGISYSQPTIAETTDGAEQDFNFPGQVSYRAGLTYEFLPKTNAYFSYSESFNPQPLLNIQNDVLPPLSGEQYELGVKYRSPNGRLLLTGALFQINQRNLGEYDQTVNGVDFYRAVGEVRHKGIELQAIGQVTPEWQINAGYAYLDPKITHDSDLTTIGKTELFLPKNTFSLYTTYSFNDGRFSGLSFSGGVRFVDSERTSYDASTKNIPDYTIVDISASYEVEKWAFQLSIHNLFDETYYINNYQTLFYGNVPGDPRNISFKVTRTF